MFVTYVPNCLIIPFSMLTNLEGGERIGEIVFLGHFLPAGGELGHTDRPGRRRVEGEGFAAALELATRPPKKRQPSCLVLDILFQEIKAVLI